MTSRRVAAVVPSAALLAAVVAGCSSTSDGNGTPPTRATVTTTATATAPAPSATGAPVTGTPTGATSGATSSGPGLCTPTVMTFAVGQSSGASGTQYFPVIATNASQSSCVTTGYPGLALLDGSGNQYAQATRDSSVPVTTITVAPGEKIAASVGLRDVPEGGTGQCQTSAALLITLPDNTDSTRLQLSKAACAAVVQAFVRYTGS